VLEAEAARLHLHLSPADLDRFARHRELLLEWNERAGLTTVTDPAEVERRHFAESLALLAALRSREVLPPGTRARLADLGPGGGFPGVPMAIAEPALELVLIESHGRRAEFLRHLVQALGLDAASVVHARAEAAGRDPALRASFHLVVARALAPMAVLVEYALPLLREHGVLAAAKGSRALEELQEAAGAIELLGGVALDPVPLPLPEDAPAQSLVLVRRERPLDDRYPRRAGIPAKRPLR
jgi:16S rRNA (guanine527-N7)-methyltransferase